MTEKEEVVVNLTGNKPVCRQAGARQVMLVGASLNQEEVSAGIRTQKVEGGGGLKYRETVGRSSSSHPVLCTDLIRVYVVIIIEIIRPI